MTPLAPIFHHALILALATPGFAALALAMERHQQDVLGRLLKPRTTRGLRAGGWLLLLLALGHALHHLGGPIGIVTWVGHLSLAAGLIHVTLILLDRRKAARAPASPARGARGRTAQPGCKRTPDAG